MANIATPFDRLAYQFMAGVYNLASDTLRVALIKGASDGGVDPDVTELDARWGTGGSVDLSLSEVTPGGNYPQGGVVLTSVSLTESGGIATLDADNVGIAQDLLNPDNARWGILYDSTLAEKNCIGILDLGGVRNGQTGPINLEWAAAGLLILQVQAA